MPRNCLIISKTHCSSQKAVSLLILVRARVFSANSFCSAVIACMQLSRMRICAKRQRKSSQNITASYPWTELTATRPFLNGVQIVSQLPRAFHWFDAIAFKQECQRILRPNGKVIIVYNTRDESAECNKALAGLHRKYCPEFQGFSKGMNDEKCRAFFEGRCTVFRSDNSQTYNRQRYINRVLSSSYSLCGGDAQYAEYLAGINRLFDVFSVNGLLTVPMLTAAYIGTI